MKAAAYAKMAAQVLIVHMDPRSGRVDFAREVPLLGYDDEGHPVVEDPMLRALVGSFFAAHAVRSRRSQRYSRGDGFVADDRASAVAALSAELEARVAEEREHPQQLASREIDDDFDAADGDVIHIGCFATFIEAAIAYDDAVKTLFAPAGRAS